LEYGIELLQGLVARGEASLQVRTQPGVLLQENISISTIYTRISIHIFYLSPDFSGKQRPGCILQRDKGKKKSL